ncbi:hypothetical protein R0J90_14940, partial [Micrococcus sp. SIMBA_144]
MDLKETIIAEQPVLITDLTKIIPKIWPVLLSFKKINVTWSNVVAYFKEKEGLDTDLVKFLNSPEIASELSKHYIADFNDYYTDTLKKIS